MESILFSQVRASFTGIVQETTVVLFGWNDRVVLQHVTMRSMDPKKASLTRYFIGVALPGIATCLISGWFSYSKAKFESEIGYKALADAVKEIQPAMTRLELKIAKLEGRVDSLQHMLAVTAPVNTGHGARHLPTPVPTPAPVVQSPAVGGVPYRPMKALPNTLDDAVQQMKR